MIRKFLVISALLLIFPSCVMAQMGGGTPIATNIQVFDDGVLQEGSGRSVSFYTNLTATYDSSTGYYIVHGAAGGVVRSVVQTHKSNLMTAVPLTANQHSHMTKH